RRRSDRPPTRRRSDRPPVRPGRRSRSGAVGGANGLPKPAVPGPALADCRQHRLRAALGAATGSRHHHVDGLAGQDVVQPGPRLRPYVRRILELPLPLLQRGHPGLRLRLLGPQPPDLTALGEELLGRVGQAQHQRAHHQSEYRGPPGQAARRPPLLRRSDRPRSTVRSGQCRPAPGRTRRAAPADRRRAAPAGAGPAPRGPAGPTGRSTGHQPRLSVLNRGKAPAPAYRAASSSSSSIRRSWLYLATRSDRAGAPVLIWPQSVATARSAIVVSSVSPERWLITQR